MGVAHSCPTPPVLKHTVTLCAVEKEEAADETGQATDGGTSSVPRCLQGGCDLELRNYGLDLRLF